ncbi:chemotaxis protein [Pelagicoccus sp. SDUM812003]|uniref:chemotaxis protein CheV n=1 Tax=Pelagicoccus sp. SDUM812003 TaxID=3041267 RepID=UPI00280D2E05|nr:chemotaxis protein [Pelagicoccus sp. SDUM812003]MDQ8203821.1 chemotaxis protein [Pelagicoccus sp. SDUM812003]
MSKVHKNTDILLEAGTNEVEVFEFNLGGHHYGVNVAKVNQIIQRDQVKITRTDCPPHGVLGTITFRGKPTMTLDLRSVLGIYGEEPDPSRALMLVTQFNDQVVAFAIDGAERIHRVSWEKFEPISSNFAQENPYVNGIIRLDDRLVLILDLEYILTLINPRLGMTVDTQKLQKIEEEFKPRDHIKILFAEDSAMIRKMVHGQLMDVGFTNVDLATNGSEALDKVRRAKEESDASGTPFSEYYDLILTDIEMPVMDGLTFCKRVKQELALETPVIVFSSLINDQMIAKCKAVGANGWGTKPKVNLIVNIIDRLIVQGESQIGDLLD